jgi:hypothetical protein
MIKTRAKQFEKVSKFELKGGIDPDLAIASPSDMLMQNNGSHNSNNTAMNSNKRRLVMPEVQLDFTNSKNIAAAMSHRQPSRKESQNNVSTYQSSNNTNANLKQSHVNDKKRGN